MNIKKLYLPLILCGLMTSQKAMSETRFSLPRDTQGVEVLVGMGASYDKTAFIGDDTLTEASPTIAIMTDDIYLDIHQISYRRSLNKNLNIKVFGTQDGIATDEDVDILNIKSGESFDLGMSVEKSIGSMRVGGLISADVTGTHSGYLLEANIGKDVVNERSKFGFTVGGRFQDEKRSNYFYGVTKEEAFDNIAEYDADEEFTAFASAKFAYQLTRNLGLLFDANISQLVIKLKKVRG